MTQGFAETKGSVMPENQTGYRDRLIAAILESVRSQGRAPTAPIGAARAADTLLPLVGEVIDWIETELYDEDEDNFRDIPAILTEARTRFCTEK